MNGGKGEAGRSVFVLVLVYLYSVLTSVVNFRPTGTSWKVFMPRHQRQADTQTVGDAFWYFYFVVVEHPTTGVTRQPSDDGPVQEPTAPVIVIGMKVKGSAALTSSEGQAFHGCVGSFESAVWWNVGTTLVIHSQSTTVPVCPGGFSQLSTGYSLAVTRGYMHGYTQGCFVVIIWY